MRSIYEPLLRDLLADTEAVSAGEVLAKALPYHREFFRRLQVEGILDPLSGVDLLL